MLCKKKILLGFVLVFSTLFFLAGCQDIFTASAFGWAAKDPSQLSKTERETYAKDVVKSGDSQEMKKVFDALEDDLPDNPASDPELYLLATDLALGGSGLSDAITEAASLVSDPSSVDQDQVMELIEGIDEDYVENAVELFEQVSTAAPESVSEEQYVNAAVAQVFEIYTNLNTDPANPPDQTDITNHPDFANAQTWAQSGGLNLDDLTGLLGGSGGGA